MDVSFYLNNEYLKKAYDLSAEQTGLLKGYAIKALNVFLCAVREDARLACAVSVVANLAIFKTTLVIMDLLDKSVEHFFGAKESWSESGILLNSLVVISLSISIIVCLNMVLQKRLTSSLPPILSVALSVSSCVGYACLSARYSNSK